MFDHHVLTQLCFYLTKHFDYHNRCLHLSCSAFQFLLSQLEPTQQSDFAPRNWKQFTEELGSKLSCSHALEASKVFHSHGQYLRCPSNSVTSLSNGSSTISNMDQAPSWLGHHKWQKGNRFWRGITHVTWKTYHQESPTTIKQSWNHQTWEIIVGYVRCSCQ